MGRRRRITFWIAAAAVLAAGIVAALWPRIQEKLPITLEGAVIMQDADVNKEQPLSGVRISVEDGLATGVFQSDSSGLFKVTLNWWVRRGQIVTLELRHSGYEPLSMKVPAGDRIYLARMLPIPSSAPAQPLQQDVLVSDIRVRYTVQSVTEVNVGSLVKTFQVANTGDMPCNDQPPCSPDGRWKAEIGTTTIDAGQGNVFQNARVSCIAGPCPFTNILDQRFSRDGRRVSVSVVDWSDPTTFLFEAEVFHPMASDNARESYPVVFGQALNFTLPAGVEGVSIEADLNRSPVVFPLGPDLSLCWASCVSIVNADKTKVYRCELKPGYRF